MLSKNDLSSKKKIYDKLGEPLKHFNGSMKIFNEDELLTLVISAIRTNDWQVCASDSKRKDQKYHVNMERVQDWLTNRVQPNTIKMKTNDPELLKLLVFSLAKPYKMRIEEKAATISEKRRKTIEPYFGRIFSDTFIGKIGEIAYKKFLNDRFERQIQLDWGISTEIKSFKSDIIGSKKTVSIKSTDTLESIWAEAPVTAEYGIFIKVALPKDFFMKLLAHISSLKKLLNFVKDRIQNDMEENKIIRDLANFIEETAYRETLLSKIT